MNDTNASGSDKRDKQRKPDEAGSSGSIKPTQERTIYPEMSMQDAFAEVLKKMKAGMKMDLREPEDK